MHHAHSSMTFASAPADRTPPFAGGWRGALDRRWHPMELASMIVGFVLFWPIGLAILGWKKWTGAPKSPRDGRSSTNFARDLGGDTGNSAFEAFKQAELERLEAERLKLHQAQADFGVYLERLKQARDREEFDRFMGERATDQSPRPAA
ncbi:DUF2852 domain-containing protein [Phreatobacter aquaticus]|uniref:DUF2852 domain-containing protein n=1 Tax=Phreatobacter aquaticus TaxID=2570229 RepID=A0A4D7QT23_9HYPH|nr:DUF2852 domain-containing protein [Phreatobacter aquaticus]QCK88227.1 DUF2852 domain-containing protein [Phreatobacter aquaticus]